MTKRRYLPALRGRLGDWAFYSVLMTLKQVAEKVNYAKEVHNSVKLSELIQRELDDKTRAGEIGNYLLTNEDRFFNSLVVAVYDGDPEWHEFHNLKPISSDINVDDIDYGSRYSVGYLSLSGSEKLFALDGQHRLAGIRSALAQDESIGEDEVSVIVVAHHTSAAGQKRTRKLFTTLNKTAKPVSKSEIIALDEADAMAITARHLVEGDRRFSDKLVHIKSKQPNLPQTDREHLITLINLYDCVFQPIVDGRFSRSWTAFQMNVDGVSG
ncbi:MAG: DGQHR domain-containing protein [Ideonella sp.]|nr:DGQHR domain-containing protein [Ideonella sp.]